MPPASRSAAVWRLAGTGLAVALAYVLAAKLGFRLAVIAEQVRTVGAPAGIAVAALLLWGRALGPAIWLAAFAASLGTAAPGWTAMGVATGNTIEALLAAMVLRRLRGFDPSFRRVADVVAFILIAAVMSTAVGATIGVAALTAAGVQPWSSVSGLWFDWWLGDALGVLVVAPAILTAARMAPAWQRRNWFETAAFLAGTAFLTQPFFGAVLVPLVGPHPVGYVVFTIVIVVAVRLGQPSTALVVLMASGVASWNTVRGAGPFAGPTLHESLSHLQLFMGLLAGTGFLLAAAIAERRTSEHRRAAANAAGEVLSSAGDLAQAAPKILRAICENLGWQIGAFWLVDWDTQRIRCVATWTTGAEDTKAFTVATAEITFASGVGLPGRVWSAGKAGWIEDVRNDSNFPRAAAAERAHLRGAFAFPICLEEETLGVIECFTHSVAAPDADLLRTMSTVGNQVGQFIGRKRGEEALRAGQERTGAILDSALDAIIGMDHLGTVTEFNRAAERTFGYTREEAVGRELADLLIPRALRDPHRGGLSRYLATGHGPFVDRRVETTACRADGSEFPVEVSITRVSGTDPPRFTGFVRDLTDRVRAERERERLLQRESQARREAETASRAKDDFLAILSHELRTPLNAIVGWTRMLLDGSLDERSSRHALEVIDRNAHLQVQLVGDILDVSRIITGGLTLNIQPMDLGSVIGAALDSVRPAADAKRIRVRASLAPSARLLEGDPQRLQQIIWNLLANAVKFTPADGTVDVEVVDAGDAGVRLSVADSGEGIDPAFLPHVFERFQQADSSISRQHGGLGLGLAIVRHLVELHGGTVQVQSAGRGLGSTFTVSLPRAGRSQSTPAVPAGAPRADRPPPRRDAPSLAGCRILVVDDEQDARELLELFLTAAGATVATAKSVNEALRHLDGSAVDVLLTDIGMPGEDGFALIREVRRREALSGRRIAAAAVTAYAGDADRERAVAAGFDRHVPKPIDPPAIVEAVHAMWRD